MLNSIHENLPNRYVSKSVEVLNYGLAPPKFVFSSASILKGRKWVKAKGKAQVHEETNSTNKNNNNNFINVSVTRNIRGIDPLLMGDT